MLVVAEEAVRAERDLRREGLEVELLRAGAGWAIYRS